MERGRSNTELAAQAIDPGEGTAFELQINGGGPTGWLWDEKSWSSNENNSIVPKTAHPDSQANTNQSTFIYLHWSWVEDFKRSASKDSWPPLPLVVRLFATICLKRTSLLLRNRGRKCHQINVKTLTSDVWCGWWPMELEESMSYALQTCVLW